MIEGTVCLIFVTAQEGRTTEWFFPAIASTIESTDDKLHDCIFYTRDTNNYQNDEVKHEV